MSKKIILSSSLALALILTQVGVVLAAPVAQTGDVTGIVTNIVVDDTTDPDTVLVSFDDGMGGTQTVRILATYADEPLNLVTIDEFGVATANAFPTEPITILGSEILSEEGGAGEEEVSHPVALALAAFFGIPAEEIMDVHEQGVCEGSTGGEGSTEGEEEGTCDSHSIGFGLIAQALWMSNDLGDETGFSWQEILLAKQEKDFSDLLSEDYTGPDITNWGQFKKYVREGQEDPDKGHNLGGVMSEREDPVVTEAPESAPTGEPTTGDTTLQTTGSDSQFNNDQNQGNGNGNGQNKNKGKGNNGKGKGKNH